MKSDIKWRDGSNLWRVKWPNKSFLTDLLVHDSNDNVVLVRAYRHKNELYGIESDIILEENIKKFAIIKPPYDAENGKSVK